MMNMRTLAAAVLLTGAFLALAPAARAGKADGRLDIHWTDVEGGAATLIVTPAGQSVLIDAGMPNERDRDRILRTVRETAGLSRIDYLVATHFDLDHYGGVAGLAGGIEIGTVIDPGIPGRMSGNLKKGVLEYLDAVGEIREEIEPGDTLPLASGAVPLALRCLGANQKFIPTGSAAAADCTVHPMKDPDRSQNANSIVLLLEFGPFRFLDAADLTWNLEHELVCPVDRVGGADVYQVDHHGLDSSNNPAIVHAVAPTVAVANNGPAKGPGPATWGTLSSAPSIRAIYQMHRNVRNKPAENTTAERTANLEAECEGNIISLHVEPDGSGYTVRIPATGFEEKWETRSRD